MPSTTASVPRTRQGRLGFRPLHQAAPPTTESSTPETGTGDSPHGHTEARRPRTNRAPQSRRPEAISRSSSTPPIRTVDAIERTRTGRRTRSSPTAFSATGTAHDAASTTTRTCHRRSSVLRPGRVPAGAGSFPLTLQANIWLAIPASP
ncbi:hypothetical protein ACFQ1I_19725 [Kitasatospora arboriphila]